MASLYAPQCTGLFSPRFHWDGNSRLSVRPLYCDQAEWEGEKLKIQKKARQQVKMGFLEQRNPGGQDGS